MLVHNGTIIIVSENIHYFLGEPVRKSYFLLMTAVTIWTLNLFLWWWDFLFRASSKDTVLLWATNQGGKKSVDMVLSKSLWISSEVNCLYSISVSFYFLQQASEGTSLRVHNLPYVPPILSTLLDLISPAKINISKPRFESYDPWDMATSTAFNINPKMKDRNFF